MCIMDYHMLSQAACLQWAETQRIFFGTGSTTRRSTKMSRNAMCR